MSRFGLIFLHVLHIATAESCVSMVQRQAAPRRASTEFAKAWEVNRYAMAAYHKAGVYLLSGLWEVIWSTLEIPEDLVGGIQFPCYGGVACKRPGAPVLRYIDAFNSSLLEELKSSSPKRLLVAGGVRNPLTMVASAYCYHHSGKEYENRIINTPLLMRLPGRTFLGEVL